MQAGQRRNVGIMVRVPDASGLLTGKVRYPIQSLIRTTTAVLESKSSSLRRCKR